MDRISELPDEIIVAILSFLPLKEAVCSSVLSWRWLDLWKRTPNMRFDRISQMPDKVLVLILSFLHLREAAATSALSSRFANLWKLSPNLSFDGGIVKLDLMSRWKLSDMQYAGKWDVERCRFVKVVDSVLRSHRAVSLKEFGVSFYVNGSAQSKLIEWLTLVFLRGGGVERLKLEFGSAADWEKHKVVFGELLRESGLRRPEALKPLRTLCLRSIQLSGEDIELFLCNCPFLEELIVDEADLTSDIEVRGAAALRRLELSFFGSRKSTKVVSAPNLVSLMVEDTSGKLLLKNVPKLVEGNFRFRGADVDEMLHFASAVFCFGSQLKLLELTIFWPKVFFANVFPQLPNLERLVVKCHGVRRQSLLPVTALVWASPRLQEFKLEYTKISNAASTEVVEKVARSPHRHLKVFELVGFVAVSDHVELATYVLDNCVALQKIIINCQLSSPCMGVFRSYSQLVNELRSAKEYAKQQLQGKLPQHIQLHIL